MMFDSALIRGRTPQLENNPHPPGGVAASRHALAKHHYLEEKRSRLEAEATKRRRVAIEQRTAYALTRLGRIWNAAGRLIHIATRRPAHGH